MSNSAVTGGAIAMDFRSSVPTGVSIDVCVDEIMENQFVNIYDNTFNGNYADDNTNLAYGGALYLLCLDLTVYQVDFDSNYASYDNGGGVAYIADTNTKIDDCTFDSSGRSISNSGGLFHIDNYDESNAYFAFENSVIKNYRGGTSRRRLQDDDQDNNLYSLMTIANAASMKFENIIFSGNGLPLIYAQQFSCPEITFDKVKFTDNTGYAVIDMDHVTTIQEDSITTFDSCEFENNTVTFGLIRLGTSRAEIINTMIKGNQNTQLISTFVLVIDATITGTQFIRNYGKYDGILSIGAFATVNIINSTFADNEVGGNGGAIQSKASELYIRGSSFIDNTAGLNGGHIAQFENKLIIDSSEFIGGKANGNGGGIWMSRSNIISGMITQITNTIFDGNFAGYHGGAILQDTPSENDINSLSISNVDFRNNYANHSGAAIYIRSKYDIDVNIDYDTVTFVNNNASQIEGDLQSWPESYNISSNSTEICPGCEVTISVETTDLFGNPWPPHTFYEYLFSADTNVNISSDSVISDFAVNTKETFEILQGMSPFSGIEFDTAQISTVFQSKYFINGVGHQIFTYGPAILYDSLTLKITGFASDGFVEIDEVNITFDVIECLPHMGADIEESNSEYHAFRCSECVRNTYRFIPDVYTEGCRACPNNAVCNGGDEVYVENDHYPLITSSGLEVLECAPGTCCLDSLCKWDAFNDLCPINRDPSSPMCSECNNDYSVSPLSTECIKCDGINIWYFIIPGLGYALLIWWWGRLSPFDLNLQAWEIYTFKILSFYYQVLPSINLLIPDQSATTDYSKTIEGIFNFDPNIKGICALENLTNLQQLLLTLITPVTCLLWVAFFLFLDRIGCCVMTKKETQRTKCGKIAKFFLSFFFIKALVKFLYQVYAQITRTSFSLVSCRPFSDGTSHMYYSADIECYKWWHSFAFIGITLSALLPCIFLYKLLQARKNLDNNAWWHILTLGYKRRVWYYDVFRMFSRFFIILLVSVPVLESYRLVLTRWLLYMYLIIHIWLNPFDTRKYISELGFDINHLETFSLGLLCLLVHLADYEQSSVLQVYNFLKLLPAIGLVLLFIYKFTAKKFCPQIFPETAGTMRTLHANNNFVSASVDAFDSQNGDNATVAAIELQKKLSEPLSGTQQSHLTPPMTALAYKPKKNKMDKNKSASISDFEGG